ncbi:hypothetical protein COV19_05690 [Candidatus Woesearchaeota archaeon CG10_big_fil_rev_8_21_14_0_10_44_13]|nr:MAG: hypothetical protein COV19_05690 [Candidatus Woesearchaeota archaeon CG10_big_fil_rev_8_21_14_0_10_44_13]
MAKQDSRHMAKQGKEEAEISFDPIKKNLNWIILALIIIFGFYIRVYHLDYPVIGYHNWKETHYLTEARNFERYGDWLTPRADSPDIFTNPDGAHGDTLPVTSWASAIGFIFFGEKVGVARFISVLFVMAGIFFLYLVIRRLFKREDFALTAALIASTNPLLVFFGRQVQLDNPALFFGMLSIYLYIIWVEDPEDRSKMKYLVMASLFMVLSFLTKYSFALFAIPMAAIFPYRKVLQKDYLKRNIRPFIYAALPVILVPLWYLNNIRITSTYAMSPDAQNASQGDIYYNLSALFGSKFWSIVKPYTADNYTLIGMLFAGIGLILFFMIYKKSIGDRFLLAYIAGAIPWLWIMASKLSGHSYHQYPLAPLIVILIAFCFVVIAGSIEKTIHVRHTRWLFIAGLFLLLIYPPVLKYGGGIFEAKDRQFDTQFYGLDVAGDYIKEHSQPDERMFFSGHQSYGVLWEADRKGSPGHFNETVTRFGEDKYNVRWIFLYQWGLQTLSDPSKWDYIKDTYSLKQIAFQQTAQGPQILYMIFEKGGSFNETALNSVLQEKQKLNQFSTKDYELTKGTVQMVYFDV